MSVVHVQYHVHQTSKLVVLQFCTLRKADEKKRPFWIHIINFLLEWSLDEIEQKGITKMGFFLGGPKY